MPHSTAWQGDSDCCTEIAGPTGVNRSAPGGTGRAREASSRPRKEVKECPLRQPSGPVSEWRAVSQRRDEGMR